MRILHELGIASILIASLVAGCGKSSQVSTPVTTGPSTHEASEQPAKLAYTPPPDLPDYVIADTEDASHALRSSGVIDVRRVYRVVVPPGTPRFGVEAVVRDVQEKATLRNADIDEIVVYVFDNKADLRGAFTRGRGIWGVDGDIGNVTPQIAAGNDRSDYRLTILTKAPIVRAETSDGKQKRYDLDSNEVTPFEEQVSAAVQRGLENNPREDGDDTEIVRSVAGQFSLSEETVRSIDAKVVGAKAGIPWR